jgi:hypothetical protein
MHSTNLSRIKAAFNLGNISKVPNYKNEHLKNYHSKRRSNLGSPEGRAASMGCKADAEDFSRNMVRAQNSHTNKKAAITSLYGGNLPNNGRKEDI